MAPALATTRLRKELIKLQTEPPPGVIAEPKESNILTWYYAIRGPADTVYEGGIYVGKLVFPSEYPMKAPSIMMATPSGRFQTNTKICMSMSDFHPESWNPMWSVATIIQGVQSFMASDEFTTGGVKAPDSERKKFAKLSIEFNRKNFPNLFDGDIEAAMKKADIVCQKAEAEKTTETSSSNGEGGRAVARRNRRLTAAAAAVKSKTDLQQEDKDDEEEQETQNGSTAADANETLSPEEIEKRRKRNAKKRAKQKAKKAVITEAAKEDGTANGDKDSE